MGTTYTKEEKNYLAQLGNQIRVLRVDSNLSQEKLAFTCDLDRSYIGSVERGERNISVINLCKIAKALNLKTNELLDFRHE